MLNYFFSPFTNTVTCTYWETKGQKWGRCQWMALHTHSKSCPTTQMVCSYLLLTYSRYFSCKGKVHNISTKQDSPFSIRAATKRGKHKLSNTTSRLGPNSFSLALLMVIYLCVMKSGTPACYKYLTYSDKSFNLRRHVLEFRSCQNQSKITLISSLRLTEQNWDLHGFFRLTQAINDKGRFQDSASGFPVCCSSITPWHRVDVIYLELHHGDGLLFQNCRKTY